MLCVKTDSYSLSVSQKSLCLSAEYYRFDEIPNWVSKTRFGPFASFFLFLVQTRKQQTILEKYKLRLKLIVERNI